jgi:hypothetical protein
MSKDVIAADEVATAS